MPTIGYRPTLETTQAVGALLLHQFARDQFSRAGVDESLIREAEKDEGVVELVNRAQTLLNDECCGGDTTITNDESAHQQTITSCNGNIDGITNVAGLAQNNLNNSSRTNDLSNLSNAATRNSAILDCNNSFGSSNLSGTVVSDHQEQTYHSIQEQSLNGTTATNGHDRTFYHSVANSSANNDLSVQQNTSSVSTSTFERLQSSPNVTLYGDELRRIAEEFERSSLREIVRNRANQVNLADITKESFTRLLKELFQEKITREKVVILFFFCTDVALRAAEFAQELVVKLLGWSFSYIINIVCSFVHKLGGWDKVLFYQLPSLLVTCCAGLAICALIVFLRNSLRTSEN